MLAATMNLCNSTSVLGISQSCKRVQGLSMSSSDENEAEHIGDGICTECYMLVGFGRIDSDVLPAAAAAARRRLLPPLLLHPPSDLPHC